MRRASPALAQGFTNVGHSLDHILTLLYPTVVLVLENEWGRSYAELIGLMLLGQVLFGAAALPAGWLADRWSTLGMMAIYFLGTGAAAIGTGLARNPVELGLGLTAIGFFAAIYHPVGMSWLVRTTLSRGRALGWNGMFGSIGVALGPVIAGALCHWASWRMAFIVPGVVTAALGLALLGAWRLGWLVEVEANPRIAPPPPPRGEMIRVFALLSISMTCAALVYQSLTIVLPKLFAERLGEASGLGPFGIGGLVGFVYLCAGASMPISGWLADRFAMQRMYVAGFLLQVPLLFLSAFLQSWALLVVSVTLVFVGTLGAPAENKLLAHYTPGRWQGTGYGAKFVLALGVSASAIPLIAWIYGATGGFFWLFIVMGCLASVSMLAASLIPAGAGTEATTPGRALHPAAAE
ncbi:MAG: MFS transporter [Alphaproteobacteria bacterium]|nr:MFS transporter [Alphaproteobacteria bacterium]